MKVLDARHRWDGGRKVLMEPRVVHTCLVCGKTESYEILIPDSFIAWFTTAFPAARNPYRSLFA